jgi:AraC-like DNA-binding protein
VVPERGSWEFLYRGATYRQHLGLLQLKQPGELLRELRRDGPASYEIVVFEPEVLARACASSGRAGELVFALPQLAAEDPRANALLALRRLTTQAAPAAEALAIESAVAEAALALLALGAPQRAPGNERRAVQRAKDYLRERLEHQVRLDEVADHAALDKFQLIRAFRAQVGVPPYEYLTHLRVHRARALLRAGASAASAALTVGFYDQSQLHRHFVRLVGITPGRYAAVVRTDNVSVALGANRRL